MLETSKPLGTPAPTQQENSDRRGFLRYPRKLETLWQLLGLSSRDLTSGQIFNLSTTGVGLRLNQQFEVGSSLVIRLPSVAVGWVSHLVRVRRCIEVSPGEYEVGCTFVKPLSQKALQAHLGTSFEEDEQPTTPE